MNAYDFDETIFYPDSAISFAFWCAKRKPKLWFNFVPKVMKCLVQYKKGKLPRYKLERTFFSYLTQIDDFDEQIEAFWDKNESNISKWYLEQKKPDDLIISASPVCIIAPIAKRLGVNYVATEYDKEYDVFVDNLMYAKEKAKYILDHDFPVIENFYSDSLSDTPLALLAEKAHLVTNKAQTVTDWPKLDVETLKEVRKKIDTGWNIHL
ncbi:MAG: haloacid dehalogenase-like hydrolase [Eubacterium sp.]|nr:haloacid dehalogenase-like hydrolase [Eubacterium sp.]MBR0412579.1 haloacid dehalogenase-like hydrolase [Eubacterium sp.]